jgi:hypothetical protein
VNTDIQQLPTIMFAFQALNFRQLLAGLARRGSCSQRFGGFVSNKVPRLLKRKNANAESD